MFSIDNNIHAEKIREKKPFKVLFSMNIHAVANPEMSPENARSYVFFFRDGGEKISVYVGLYFIDSDLKLFYTHSANPFLDGQMAGIEEDARRFAEDLGAMLDEVDFPRMSDSEKDAWINNLDILSGRKKDVESLEPVPQPELHPPVNEGILPQSDPGIQPSPVQAVPASSVPVPAAAVLPVQVQPDRGFQTSPAASCLPPAQPIAPANAPAVIPQAQVRHGQPQRHAGKAPGQRQAVLAESIPSKEEQVPVKANIPEQAVRTGALKAPKAQLKKDIRIASGLISREKEALARLLASF